ncbi:hypothetical protein BCR34DRAFT_266016 [Clohesyomyces aquaticus]|uniref:Uncharacterized protein n=1 Tax=Clohesyomyces aquaticus TaxID=1231657 RepID=A0A1Y1Y244_9PLEO|nr:hypothetical protein BCR34DRAFT_266016 [Clohesyomyces aquaticus]
MSLSKTRLLLFLVGFLVLGVLPSAAVDVAGINWDECLKEAKRLQSPNPQNIRNGAWFHNDSTAENPILTYGGCKHICGKSAQLFYSDWGSIINSWLLPALVLLTQKAALHGNGFWDAIFILGNPIKWFIVVLMRIESATQSRRSASKWRRDENETNKNGVYLQALAVAHGIGPNQANQFDKCLDGDLPRALAQARRAYLDQAIQLVQDLPGKLPDTLAANMRCNFEQAIQQIRDLLVPELPPAVRLDQHQDSKPPQDLARARRPDLDRAFQLVQDLPRNLPQNLAADNKHDLEHAIRQIRDLLDHELPQDKKEIQKIKDEIADTVSQIGGGRLLLALVGLGLYGWTVISSFVQKIGGTWTTVPGGRIGLAMFWQWMIAAVLISNLIGQFPDEEHCRRVFRKAYSRRGLPATFTDQALRLESNQKLFQVRHFILIILALIPVVSSMVGSLAILWYLPPYGPNCRFILLVSISAVYISNAIMTSAFNLNKRTTRVIDSLIALLTTIIIILSGCGLFNTCWCWSGWSGLQHLTPEKAAVHLSMEAFKEKLKRKYPAIFGTCLASQFLSFGLMCLFGREGVLILRWSKGVDEARRPEAGKPHTLDVTNEGTELRPVLRTTRPPGHSRNLSTSSEAPLLPH